MAIVALAACSSDSHDGRADAGLQPRAPIPFPRQDPTNPFRTGRTLIIPHGGGDGLFPENTLYAFEHSMALGGDVIDVDVSMTSDHVPVAFHDGTVDGKTDGHGAIAAMPLAAVQELDAGYSFAVDGKHPFRGQGIRIPTLAEVLTRFPTALASLDLKNLGRDIIEPVCTVIRETKSIGRSFVGSDDDEQIFELRKRCPDIRTSATLADALAMWSAAESNDPAFVPAVHIDQPPYRAGGRTLVNAARLRYAHDHGVAILTWVVNDEATMRELVDMGVDGIYTGFPDRLAEIVAEHEQAPDTP